MKNMLTLSCLFLALFSCSLPPEVSRPNTIFIMADDMGYRDAGCYGQEVIQTPNIDRLASEGLRFTQVYSGSSVCAPARSVLMTGQHTGHTRVRGDPDTPGVPNKKGFDEFYGFLNQRWAHSYYPEYIWKDSTRVNLPGNSGGEKITYTHDLFADYARDFIARNREEPFFLYLPFCIPHDKFEAPDQGIYADQDWSDDAKTYAAMITRMDLTIGDIMEALKRYNLDDNTYVFFTSDNGVASSSNQWGKTRATL